MKGGENEQHLWGTSDTALIQGWAGTVQPDRIDRERGATEQAGVAGRSLIVHEAPEGRRDLEEPGEQFAPADKARYRQFPWLGRRPKRSQHFAGLRPKTANRATRVTVRLHITGLSPRVSPASFCFRCFSSAGRLSIQIRRAETMASGNSPHLAIRVSERERRRWQTASQVLGYASLSAFVKAQCDDAARTTRVATADAAELRRLRRALNRAADGLERAASTDSPRDSSEQDVSQLVREIERIVATLNGLIR
ncbi:hypothetical protein CKO28_22560 [Rhodovibrio sodomensis]|uniref:HAMP domain-containing protein n=2 Tax=Rhodovibrio sodomensis TaxID=1088 RepID=A0ABS1DMT8_9PROT|nr:hypothetical protein [Rhodovibrio sodomensis]